MSLLKMGSLSSKEGKRTEVIKSTPTVIPGPSFIREYELADAKVLSDLITSEGRKINTGYFKCTKVEASKTNKHIPRSEGDDKLEKVEYQFVAEFKVLDETSSQDPLFPDPSKVEKYLLLRIKVKRDEKKYITNIRFWKQVEEKYVDDGAIVFKEDTIWYGEGLSVNMRKAIENGLTDHMKKYSNEAIRCVIAVQGAVTHENSHWIPKKLIASATVVRLPPAGTLISEGGSD